MKKADDGERGASRYHPPRSPGEIIHPWGIAKNNREENEDDEASLPTGMFGQQERAMFTQEILQQVVIGMGRLDVDYDPEQESIEQSSMQVDSSNPYFPPIPSIPQQSRVNYPSRYAATASPEPSTLSVGVPNPSSNALSPGTEFAPRPERSPSQLSVSPPERHTSGTIGPQMSMLSPPAPPSSVNEDTNWQVIYIPLFFNRC